MSELCAPLAIRILFVKYCKRWRCTFLGLSQDGGWTDFYENLCDSLFKEDLVPYAYTEHKLKVLMLKT